jgi:hypothetical protein
MVCGPLKRNSEVEIAFGLFLIREDCGRVAVKCE